jgi:hypothetical protein
MHIRKDAAEPAPAQSDHTDKPAWWLTPQIARDRNGRYVICALGVPGVAWSGSRWIDNAFHDPAVRHFDSAAQARAYIRISFPRPVQISPEAAAILSSDLLHDGRRR